MGISFLITSFDILNGFIKTAKPKIKSIFPILLPITLPNSISVLPDKWELNDIANSGADVPKATMVKPITVVDIPKLFAKDEAPSTKISAHFISSMKPAMDSTTFIIMVVTPHLIQAYPM
jgi:hypothetical protein